MFIIVLLDESFKQDFFCAIFFERISFFSVPTSIIHHLCAFARCCTSACIKKKTLIVCNSDRKGDIKFSNKKK